MGKVSPQLFQQQILRGSSSPLGLAFRMEAILPSMSVQATTNSAICDYFEITMQPHACHFESMDPMYAAFPVEASSLHTSWSCFRCCLCLGRLSLGLRALSRHAHDVVLRGGVTLRKCMRQPAIAFNDWSRSVQLQLSCFCTAPRMPSCTSWDCGALAKNTHGQMQCPLRMTCPLKSHHHHKRNGWAARSCPPPARIHNASQGRIEHRVSIHLDPPPSRPLRTQMGESLLDLAFAMQGARHQQRLVARQMLPVPRSCTADAAGTPELHGRCYRYPRAATPYHAKQG